MAGSVGSAELPAAKKSLLFAAPRCRSNLRLDENVMSFNHATHTHICTHTTEKGEREWGGKRGGKRENDVERGEGGRDRWREKGRLRETEREWK